MDTKNKVFVVIGSVALLSAASVGGYWLFATKDESLPSSRTSPTTADSSASAPGITAQSASTTQANGTMQYKDGTYAASSKYSVPHGGINTVSADVTIAGGTITDVNIADSYADGESEGYISDFEANLSSSVNGMRLSDASFSRIGGASLTTAAFNQVIDQVRVKASA